MGDSKVQSVKTLDVEKYSEELAVSFLVDQKIIEEKSENNFFHIPVDNL